MAPRYQQCTYQGRSRLTPSLLLGFSLLITAACGREPPPEGSTAKVGTSAAGTPAAAAKPASQDDGMWPMPARSYDATRYSHQTEITRANVSNLREAWSFSTGVLRGHEAAPLVVGSTLYVVTPFPNILYAIDLTPPAGRLKWKYEPPTARAAQGVACCDVVNRGAAFSDGKIFFNTLDAHTVAVDAETGKEVWRTKLGEINQGESMTMAPLVVKGKVLVGNSGGEFGVRGWLTALEAATGKISWRAYSTGPDSAVLIGPNFRAPYPQDRGKDLGVTSWPAEQWKLGGGTVWGWLSYDPQLDLVYYGTGNPGVWNPALRPGDNKWASTLFARDPDTGEARWAYQTTPHDEHDFDGVNESILVDLPIGGRTRQVMLRPERNGFLYMIDRATGQILSADPYGKVTWASEIDLKTGRPIINEAMRTGNRQATGVCPAAPGMKDWQPAAWSPHTQLLYIPHNHLCMDYQGTEANYIAGTPYVGASVRMYSAEGQSDTTYRGHVTAWDPIGRRIAWRIKEKFPVWSGAVATAGDLVFYGTMDRWFKAVDARTGALLWKMQLGSGIIGQPITYRGPDGKQYVAVLSGVGGWAGAAALGVLPEEDPTIGLGFPIAVKDLPHHTPQGGTLHVFSLP